MKEGKIPQNQAILMYLQDEGSITSREADRELGLMRLAARIKELEGMGYSFVKTTERVPARYGGHTHITRYALVMEGEGRV